MDKGSLVKMWGEANFTVVHLKLSLNHNISFISHQYGWKISNVWQHNKKFGKKKLYFYSTQGLLINISWNLTNNKTIHLCILISDIYDG